MFMSQTPMRTWRSVFHHCNSTLVAMMCAVLLSALVAPAQDPSPPVAAPRSNVPSKEAPDSNYRRRLLEQFKNENDPPALKSIRESSRMAAPALPAPNVSGAAPSAATVSYELVVDYSNQKIAGEDVRLRTYNGALCGPVIRAKAGETLNITLRNKLPVEPGASHVINSHHKWNTTNLHFHGLHVAPQGTAEYESDNVLLELNPTTDPNGSVQKYAVKIPANHPAGTFWYHAHKHGGTAAQVASGMAGVLIIERNDAQHNLDSIPEVASAREVIMLLQQIPYLKPDPQAPGFIEMSSDGSGNNEADMFGPGGWGQLRRNITVNGQYLPSYSMAPGEVLRLRLIHTGQREEVLLRLIRAPGTTGTGPGGLNFNEIAVDGLPLGEVRTKSQLSLYPGYRSDALVQAPAGAGGEFWLVDDRAPTGNAAGSTNPLRLIARFFVSGSNVAGSLPTSASLAGQRLTPIQDSEATGTQHAFYGIVPVAGGVKFFVSQDDLSATQVPTGREFDPTETRTLTLTKTERWIVGTRNGGGIPAAHPFHIHINPFYITEVRDANQVDVTNSEVGGPTWRDTLAMKPGYTYKLLTRYEDFAGSFVNHCHILDHEDNGMMEKVTIAAAGGPSIAAAPVSALAARRVIDRSNSKSVMFFVKGSFCPGCMAQLNQLVPELNRAGAAVEVVSASSAEDVSKFPNLPCNVIPDPALEIFRKYKIVDSAGVGDTHATLVVDANQRELFRRTGDEPFMDVAAILTAVSAPATANEATMSVSAPAVAGAATAAQPPAAAVPKLRKNIDDLTAQELAVYKHALSILKSSSNAANNYDYHAALHNLFIGTSHGCEHHSDLFFPWHRYHLANFERALQATDPTHPTLSTKDLTIPYWDWSLPASGLRFAAAFEDEFNADGTPNVLFDDGRELAPSSPMYDANFISNVVRGNSDWNTFAGLPKAGGGSFGAFEQPAHNDMHGLFIGGHMSNPSEAALDPIYWSFHTFIDRQWDRWQKIHGVDPTSPTAVLRGFTGAPTVVQTIKVTDLGYFYEHTPESIAPVPAPPLVAAIQATRLKVALVDARADVRTQNTPQPKSFRVDVPKKFGKAELLVENIVLPTSFSYRAEFYLHKVGTLPKPENLAATMSIWKTHSDANQAPHSERSRATVDITQALTEFREKVREPEVTITVVSKPIPSKKQSASERTAMRGLAEVQIDFTVSELVAR